MLAAHGGIVWWFMIFRRASELCRDKRRPCNVVAWCRQDWNYHLLANSPVRLLLPLTGCLVDYMDCLFVPLYRSLMRSTDFFGRLVESWQAIQWNFKQASELLQFDKVGRKTNRRDPNLGVAYQINLSFTWRPVIVVAALFLHFSGTKTATIVFFNAILFVANRQQEKKIKSWWTHLSLTPKLLIAFDIGARMLKNCRRPRESRTGTRKMIFVVAS